jgi:hypothetical protein
MEVWGRLASLAVERLDRLGILAEIRHFPRLCAPLAWSLQHEPYAREVHFDFVLAIIFRRICEGDS